MKQIRSRPRVLRWLSAVVDWSVIIMGALMVVVVFANVVLHVLQSDLAWVTEFGEFLMVWVTFMGGAAATQRNGHLVINEFLDKLPAHARALADGAINALCLAVLGVLFYYGWGIVSESWANTLTTLQWPMAWEYMALPVAAGITIVFQSYDLVEIVRGVPAEDRYPSESSGY